MAIELKLSKPDTNTPWGFRLAGGAECDVPLTVVKISEGSIAENVGLQVNDIFVKINDYNVEKLTHEEVHDVILNAGLEFVLGIHRESLLEDVQEDERNNEEVSNILEGTLQDNVQSKEEGRNAVVSEDSLKPEVTDEQIAEAISGEAEVLPEQNILGVNFNKIDLEGSKVLEALHDDVIETKIDLQNKKWSTFLQKPMRPVVLPRKDESEGPSYPPYRVVIRKQSRKDSEIKEDLNQISAAAESEIQQEIDNMEILKVDQEGEQNENCELTRENEDQEETVEQNEDYEEIKEEMSESKVSDDEISINSAEEQQGHKITETTTTLSSLTLEEQLAHVQQQLQALAQLPSTIQVTLDAVTQQLSKIVKATHKKGDELQETTVEENITSEDETLYQMTEEENLESEMKHEDITETSDVEEELKLEGADFPEKAEEELINQDMREEDDEEEEGEIEQIPTEEEILAKQLEEEKVAQQERLEEFHQRRLEQRPTHPLTPLQRPIILPGGRRWSQPDDALPTTKKPKMSDEKISETLETYSEVITGKLKGINFLKYQPPPKNLDYLQNSEVFKMVHDMEPPGRGIAVRPGKIASEQDYYAHNVHQGGQENAVGVQ